jgi:hypothetical protein
VRKLVLDIQDLSADGDFLAADPLAFGTWTRLAMFCAAHTNGGLIQDCQEWDDMRWLRACGVSLSALKACEAAKLIGWYGSGIRVFGYPEDQEKSYLSKSRGAELARSKRLSKSLSRKGHSDISSDVKTDITSLPFASLPLQEQKKEFQAQASVLLEKITADSKPSPHDLGSLKAASQGDAKAWRSFLNSLDQPTIRFLRANQ